MENITKKCKYCDKSFEDLSDLIFHIKTVHKEKQKNDQDGDFECKICQKKFKYLWKVKRHINFFHVGDSDYKCDSCGKIFITRHNVKRHKLSCEKLKKEKIERYLKRNCHICGYSFTKKESLKSHIKIVHDKIREKKCPECDKSFGHTGTLNLHIKIVHKNSNGI